jgi:hypothetical protein
MKSRLLWFCIVAFCVPVALFAQDTASITGTVTDPTGAAIPGAQVTLTSVEHGINRAATSNSTGDYLFAALPIGSYNLTVVASGFKMFQAAGIVVRVAQKSRVDVAMQVGAASTEVTVQGTGTVAARLLIEFGADPKIAIQSVRKARPDAIENDLQEQYILGLGKKE